MNKFDKNGFQILKNFIFEQEVDESLKYVNNNISRAAAELNVSKSEYINCTGRWATTSKITRNVSKLLDDKIKKQLEFLLNSRVTLKKSNIICKTHELVDAIPFHQDISYSIDDPYHFSVWVALNDVDSQSAPLQIIKNSHTWPISSAVDYWSPYFTDQFDYKNKELEILTVQAGDAIIFDSRLYHGSDINYSTKERFAYVTRWSVSGKDFPKIPAIKPLFFGMFNCGKTTEEILQEALLYYNITSVSLTLELKEVTLIWIEFLQKKPKFKDIETATAINDLKKLFILDNAYKLHQAGNISGRVYRNLWFSLLSFLNKEITESIALYP